jgi:hypothetical protein
LEEFTIKENETIARVKADIDEMYAAGRYETM